MSDIDIRIAHTIPIAQARKQTERVAKQLKGRYGLDYAWKGNTLEFNRQGVSGTLEVGPQEVKAHVGLGLLFGFLKPEIEKQIRLELDKVFGSTPSAPAKRATTKAATPPKGARSPKSPASAKRKA